MVARSLVVRHGDESFPVDYDTDDGLEVLKFQIFSLTSVLPDDQKIVVEDGNIVLSDSSDLAVISGNLRLMSLQDDIEGQNRGGVPAEGASSGITDEELARMLQAEEDANYEQQQEFERRIRPHLSQVLMYEDQKRQQEARRTTPIDEIEEKALVSLWKEGVFNPTKQQKKHAFLLQLLFWFKQSFRWVNAPDCDSCGSKTEISTMGAPLASEACYGASRVEIYRCKSCFRDTRFPRYNDPLKLLETRKGRCGEWANCFTLYCRAFGYESRLVFDFTDHAWTECFSPILQRWMHLDPCEGIYDNPLLYEKGWNKKLSYVIAISKDGAHDVTKRYTRKWQEVLSRRNVEEAIVSAALLEIKLECRRHYSHEEISILAHRDQNEEDELNSHCLPSASDSLISLPGRQSGSTDWRLGRSELGSSESSSLSSSYCPLRTCTDTHVSDIFNALSHLLMNFQSNGLITSIVVLYMRKLRKSLVDLKSSSFKAREAIIDLSSDGSELFKDTISSLSRFLAAISVKMDNLDQNIRLSLAGEPVQTSVALLVALDALDEIVESLGSHGLFEQKFISSFSQLNRISSGVVVASGEELPFGISTSAFDGTHCYKWEDPNGAKGCWLIYKIADGKKQDLAAYELMSANDAPERDPKDWIVEGSEDGGLSWYTLDEQKSQLFEKRFHRKRFDVQLSRKSNAFRFRFLTVRDAEVQSRFQIGSIDLYARDS